ASDPVPRVRSRHARIRISCSCEDPDLLLLILQFVLCGDEGPDPDEPFTVRWLARGWTGRAPKPRMTAMDVVWIIAVTTALPLLRQAALTMAREPSRLSHRAG